MKKIIILTILIFAFIGSFATPLTENFDTLVTSGYGNYTYNGWSITAGIAETTASKQRNGTKALRLNKSTTFGENLISPMKTGGIGNISFWYRHWDGDANVLGYDIEISQNGTTWTTIGTITNFNSTTYTQFNVAVNNAAAAYIRIIHTSGNERLIIDDISITDFSSTGCTGYKRDTIQNEICSFDSINFRGAYYKGTGFYSDTVISSSSVICDSIYTLNLSTKNSTLYPFNASICSTNDSILFKGNYLKTAGKYYDTITRIGNCDSIAELNLSLNYCPTPCSELFISEYIEGGGNNKALEFYNPTSTTINLTGYSIVVLRGSSNDTIQLSGMVLANDVHVISHASASLVNIIAHSDATAPIYYNGDDVIYLLKGNIVIDAFGNLPLAGNYAKDNTYQRKQTINKGALTWNVADWNVLPKDTDSLIGSHVSNCGVICTTTIRDTVSIGICNGDSVLFNSMYYSAAGFYSDTTTLSTGCDSISTLNLTIFAYGTRAVNISSCGSYTLNNGRVITISGVYNDTMVLPGCDSILMVNVTINTTQYSICLNC